MNKRLKNKLVIFIIFLFIIFTTLVLITSNSIKQEIKIRLGYFYGGRLDSLYIAKMQGYFKEEGLDVELWTKIPDEKILIKLPDDNSTFMKMYEKNKLLGRMSGVEIIDEMMKDNLDGGGIGEASFITSTQYSYPIIAVAELGHCQRDKPCRGLVVRNGVNITKPEDFKGKRVCFIREGSGDDALLKMFFDVNNISYKKDVELVVVEDKNKFDLIRRGEVDACLFHYHHIKHLIENEKNVYLYQGVDWVNPELSLAVLVFKKDFIEKYPEVIEKFMKAFIKSLNEENKETTELLGLADPVNENPPLVRIKLLEEKQEIMLKYELIDKKVDLNKYIDNSFVLIISK